MGCIILYASGSRTISASAENKGGMDFRASVITPIRLTAALVCGSSVGTWELLSSADGLLITNDGEKLLVRRNI